MLTLVGHAARTRLNRVEPGQCCLKKVYITASVVAGNGDRTHKNTLVRHAHALRFDVRSLQSHVHIYRQERFPSGNGVDVHEIPDSHTVSERREEDIIPAHAYILEISTRRGIDRAEILDQVESGIALLQRVIGLAVGKSIIHVMFGIIVDSQDVVSFRDLDFSLEGEGIRIHDVDAALVVAGVI